MSDIIALCGPQQVGKTTAAKSLSEHFKFVRVSFADPLYDMIATLLRIPVALVRELPKNEPLEVLEGRTLRYTLQMLGSEWGRSLIGSEIWVNTALRRVKTLVDHGTRVVIDDCRFLNEYTALRKAGAKMVLLQRAETPEQHNTSHASEIEWPNFPHFDARVMNPPDGAAHWGKTAAKTILTQIYDS